MAGKMARVRRTNKGIAEWGRQFGLIFWSLLDSIKIKHGPDLIVDIARF